MKIKSLLLCSCVVLNGIGPGRSWAREVLVSGPAELSSALQAVRPGDILTLKNDTGRDTSLVITDGDEPRPRRIQKYVKVRP